MSFPRLSSIPFRGRRASRLPALALLAGAAVFSAPAVHATVLANIDFNESADLSDNFRKLFNSGTNTMAVNTDAGVLQFSPVASYIHVYDTTPADGSTKSTFSVTPGGDPLVITANFSVPTANSSIGIYIIDPTSETSAYLALLNINNSGDKDLIRFSSNANPSSSSNAGTLNSGTLSSGEAVALNTPTQLTVTYGINASNEGVLTLSAGGHSDSVTFTGTALSTVEIGWRFAAATGAGFFTFDDFQISQGAIPEPSSAALLAGLFGLGATAGLRRSRR